MLVIYSIKLGISNGICFLNVLIIQYRCVLFSDKHKTDFSAYDVWVSNESEGFGTPPPLNYVKIGPVRGAWPPKLSLSQSSAQILQCSSNYI